MKKLCLIIVIGVFGCSSSKPLIIDPSVFKDHPKPYKIFGIGKWKPGYSVLTLVDAKSSYFTVITKNNEAFSKGAIYSPER